MHKSIHLTLSLIFVIAIGFSLNLSAQQTTTPPAPTPASTPQAVGTATLSPEEQIVHLESRIAELERAENEEDSLLRLFFIELFEYLWIFPLIFILWVFYEPINKLIQNIDRTQIEIGGIKYSSESLKHVIIDREILKFGINVAIVDDEVTVEERDYLRRRASIMTGRMDHLMEEDKLIVLNEAILIATIDQEFQSQEYEAIADKAAELNIPQHIIDDMIRDRCKKEQIPLPEQLRDQSEPTPTP